MACLDKKSQAFSRLAGLFFPFGNHDDVDVSPRCWFAKNGSVCHRFSLQSLLGEGCGVSDISSTLQKIFTALVIKSIYLWDAFTFANDNFGIF
jgi:hypothetical protein